MRVVQSFLVKNPCYRSGRKIKVKGLMLHSVGCAQPKAAVFINSRNRKDFGAACVHALLTGQMGACIRRCHGITEAGIVHPEEWVPEIIRISE